MSYKVCGLDLLPSRLLKLNAEFIAPSLTNLFQSIVITLFWQVSFRLD